MTTRRSRISRKAKKQNHDYSPPQEPDENSEQEEVVQKQGRKRERGGTKRVSRRKRRKTVDTDSDAEEEIPPQKPKSATTRKIRRNTRRKAVPQEEEDDQEYTEEAAAAEMAKVLSKGKKKGNKSSLEEGEDSFQDENSKSGEATPQQEPIQFTGYVDKSVGQKFAEASDFSGKHFVDYFPHQFSQFDWTKIIMNLEKLHATSSFLKDAELNHLEKWKTAIDDEIQKILGEATIYALQIHGGEKSNSNKKSKGGTVFNVRGKDQKLTELKGLLRRIDNLFTNHNNSSVDGLEMMTLLRERKEKAATERKRREEHNQKEWENLKYFTHDPAKQIRYFLDRHGIQKGLKEYAAWKGSNALKQGMGIAAQRADAIEDDDDDDLLNEIL